MHSEDKMDSWLKEFNAGQTEEEEYCNFAQTLLQEFSNWDSIQENKTPISTKSSLIRNSQQKEAGQKYRKAVPFGLVNAPALTQSLHQCFYCKGIKQ